MGRGRGRRCLLALALEEIAGGDGAVSTIMSVHNSVGCMPILSFGTAEQKDRFLRPMARGEKLGAFCLTEPQAGSDAAAIRTRARRDGNHWVSTAPSSSSPTARTAMSPRLRRDQSHRRQEGHQRLYRADRHARLSCGPSRAELGQRCSDTAQIVLEGCRLTPDLMLGDEGKGYNIALANLEGGRIGIAAQSVGMARSAFRHASPMPRNGAAWAIRSSSIRPWLSGWRTWRPGSRPLEQLVLHAAPCAMPGFRASRKRPWRSSTRRRWPSGYAPTPSQIHGGYGYLEDFPVERIYRDVRVCQIYEGTSDIQRLIISRKIAAED